MRFETFLGKHLKDDDVIEVLEIHSMKVWYDFDRSHEGLEDIYWSEAPASGFIFRFNE
jgi:hypothetical protein